MSAHELMVEWPAYITVKQKMAVAAQQEAEMERRRV